MHDQDTPPPQLFCKLRVTSRTTPTPNSDEEAELPCGLLFAVSVRPGDLREGGASMSQKEFRAATASVDEGDDSEPEEAEEGQAETEVHAEDAPATVAVVLAAQDAAGLAPTADPSGPRIGSPGLDCPATSRNTCNRCKTVCASAEHATVVAETPRC